MEDALDNLRLLDDEEEAFQGDEEAAGGVHQLCLVGRCLTDSVVHFPSLRNTMADFWHPIGGICITELGEKRYLFQFFHEVDLERVHAGIPWFFNNHLLILQKVPTGVNPAEMELNHSEFWMQVHELPPGLMSVAMAKQFGDFCGKFVEYDSSILTMEGRNYLRIRLGHGESYCPCRLTIDSSIIVFGWDLSLRAEVRRRSMVMSRWLRTIDGSPCNDENLAGVKNGNLFNMEKDLGLNARGFGRNLNPRINPNLIPLGTAQIQGIGTLAKGRDGNLVGMSSEGVDYGPMELALVEENDPLRVLKGKKWERLDHGVSSLNWVNLFPGYRLKHLSHSFSDHCPLLLDTLGMAWNNQNGSAKAFHFETNWCLDNSFEGLVRKWWDEESGGVLNKLEKMGH
ncbi:hypothetical protein Golob_027803 [Gossypium lobatum]|uniref:DUF4283 domain-containing protein n=1 Tax=Gossypium lobatum TaxID=34289 RepID=A0A7J8NGY9_9ROSI|nr:hypothetical protein [Gossypium lobatum]